MLFFGYSLWGVFYLFKLEIYPYTCEVHMLLQLFGLLCIQFEGPSGSLWAVEEGKIHIT